VKKKKETKISRFYKKEIKIAIRINDKVKGIEPNLESTSKTLKVLT